MPRRWVFLSVTFATALVLAAAIAYLMPVNQVARHAPAGQALVGGPFELTSHTGERVSEKTFHGKHMLLYFGYTYCPDVCPTELQVMSAALDKLGGTADQVQPIFVTIDPERDTAKTMATYVANFHPKLIGLTGSAEDIAKIAKAYRVYYARAKDDGSSSEYLMDHSSIYYLMGPDGAFKKHFTYTTDAEKLANGIKAALSG